MNKFKVDPRILWRTFALVMCAVYQNANSSDRGEIVLAQAGAIGSCSVNVTTIDFEANQPYLLGLPKIPLGMTWTNALHALDDCKISYRIGTDASPVKRIEIALQSGGLTGMTLYSLNERLIETVAWSVGQWDSGGKDLLEQAAIRRYGNPSQRTSSSDIWQVAGIQLNISNGGASIFRP